MRKPGTPAKALHYVRGVLSPVPGRAWWTRVTSMLEAEMVMMVIVLCRLSLPYRSSTFAPFNETVWCWLNALTPRVPSPCAQHT